MADLNISEQRFREGSGEKYLKNGNVRCQAVANNQVFKWRQQTGDFDTPNKELWPECQCTNGAVPGMFVCRFHGGQRQPRQVRSMLDVIPFDMREKFEMMLNDPAYISRREEIALLRAREMEILEHISDGIGNPEAWGIVSDALAELRRGDEKLAEARLAEAIKSANEDRRAWGEIYDLQKLLKDTTGVEVKTAATLKTMATAEQVSRLISRVYEILMSGAQKYINDNGQRALFITYVAGELGRATNFSPATIGGLIEAGSGEVIGDS